MKTQLPSLITNQLQSPSTEWLSRFGIKNAQDVIAFLRSPAGKTTIAALAHEVAEIEAIDEDEHRAEETLLQQHHRFILFLLLELLYERDVEAQKLNKEIQLEIGKARHNPKPKPHSPEEIEHETLHHSIENNLKDAEFSENDLVALTQQLNHVEVRYLQYNAVQQNQLEMNPINAPRPIPAMKKPSLDNRPQHAINQSLQNLVTLMKNMPGNQLNVVQHRLIEQQKTSAPTPFEIKQRMKP